jgi:hypothetical protein
VGADEAGGLGLEAGVETEGLELGVDGLELPVEVPLPVIELELALGRELPEHPFKRKIHDRRAINAVH